MNQPARHTPSLVLDRRRSLQLGAAAASVVGLQSRAAAALAQATPDASPVAAGDVPVSGDPAPELSAFDELVTATMQKWSLPGGQLAIAYEGRLVYNRGFGFASVEDGEATTPDHLFRIASTTKPITSVAILKLVDAGQLTLDTPVFPLLALEGPANAPYDARLDSITVEQLLVHSGGWNSAAGYDPQYLPWPLLASHVLSAENPAEAETIVRFMLSQPLDFDPGTASAYSNFGFNVLGRVIEHVSGKSYEEYVTADVLAPAGVTTMSLGGTTLAERKVDEVRYYSPSSLEPRASVYPGAGFVPFGYGGYYMPSLDSHGGLIGSAENLVQFALAVDGQRGDALLSADSVTAMETTERPPSAATGAGNAETSLGLGFNSRAVDGGYEWSHAGALEGSNCSWLVRQPNGTAIACVFNTLPEDYGTFFGETIPAMLQLLAETTTWPETDQFS